MSAIVPTNPFFQDQFNSYYGVSRLGQESKNNFYNIFNYYCANSKALDFNNILTDLHDQKIGTNRIEKSFGSKMLHTLKPDEPIIDKIVIDNLRRLSCTAPYFAGVPQNIRSIQNAVKLHNALKDCYTNHLIPCAKATGYFSQFNNAFPAAAQISEVKKIDFYLWAM